VVYLSGQLSHDEHGNLVGPAPVDAAGQVIDGANMELQMRTTYANAVRLLERFGATLDNVVEETLYVVDFDAAFAVAGKVRKAAYGTDVWARDDDPDATKPIAKPVPVVPATTPQPPSARPSVSSQLAAFELDRLRTEHQSELESLRQEVERLRRELGQKDGRA
jgi:enamine deaminase RidA (YjgF/YER057c/UK114 family)